MAEAKASTSSREKSTLSLERLRAAFSQMLGKPNSNSQPSKGEAGTDAEALEPVPAPAAKVDAASFEVSPRAIVEAILFVGRPDDRPVSVRELAAAIRGVTPREVEEIVDSLNQAYCDDQAPYRIIASPGGLQMKLRSEFDRMRDQFFGRIREAKLTSAAIEVLAMVAYQQPVTLARINERRGAHSSGVLNMLVRRQLVRLDRPAESPRTPHYSTTERFLRLFHLSSLDELPTARELDG